MADINTALAASKEAIDQLIMAGDSNGWKKYYWGPWQRRLAAGQIR